MFTIRIKRKIPVAATKSGSISLKHIFRFFSSQAFIHKAIFSKTSAIVEFSSYKNIES